MRIIRPIVRRIEEHDFNIQLLGHVAINVKRGDKVRVGDPLYKREYKKILESYTVQKELGVAPTEAYKYLVRLDGEYVTKGEILAERLANGGLVVKKIYATTDGLLSFDRLNKGYIDILSEFENEEVSSNLSGTVIDFDHQRHISIRSKAFAMDTISSWNGEDIDGSLVMVKTGDSVYTVNDLEESYNEKIVFAGRFAYPDLIAQIIKRGAKGVVVWSMNYKDYESVKNHAVVMGGFGQIPFDYTISHAISSMNGSHVMISDSSIVIADAGQYLLHDNFTTIKAHLKVNDHVKVIDNDNFGLVGKIVDTTNDDGYYTVAITNGDRLLIAESFLTPIF